MAKKEKTYAKPTTDEPVVKPAITGNPGALRMGAILNDLADRIGVIEQRLEIYKSQGHMI